MSKRRFLIITRTLSGLPALSLPACIQSRVPGPWQKPCSFLPVIFNDDARIAYYQYSDLLTQPVLAFNSTDPKEMVTKIERYLDTVETVTEGFACHEFVNLEHAVELLFSMNNATTGLFMNDYGMTARAWRLLERLDVFEKFVTVEEMDRIYRYIMTHDYRERVIGETATGASFSDRADERYSGTTGTAVAALGRSSHGKLGTQGKTAIEGQAAGGRGSSRTGRKTSRSLPGTGDGS